MARARPPGRGDQTCSFSCGGGRARARGQGWPFRGRLAPAGLRRHSHSDPTPQHTQRASTAAPTGQLGQIRWQGVTHPQKPSCASFCKTFFDWGRMGSSGADLGRPLTTASGQAGPRGLSKTKQGSTATASPESREEHAARHGFRTRDSVAARLHLVRPQRLRVDVLPRRAAAPPERRVLYSQQYGTTSPDVILSSTPIVMTSVKVPSSRYINYIAIYLKKFIKVLYCRQPDHLVRCRY